MRDELEAGAVAGELAGLLAPLVEATVAGLDLEARELAMGEREVGGRRAHVVVMLQRHPLIARVVLVGLPNAVELDRVPGAAVADPEALAAAADRLIAGTLERMADGDREAALLAAGLDGTDFLLTLDTMSGEAVVSLVPRAGALADGVDLGGVKAMAH